MKALRAVVHGLALAFAPLAIACSSDGASAPSDQPSGHSVRAEVRLVPDDGGETVTFLTPALSTFTMPVTDIVGKPYYVAVFDGGFDQGVDFDRHHAWGEVGDDLVLTYESPRTFENGPYDVSLIVYTQSEITDAIRADYYAVVPRSGELSAFSLSQDRVKEGDPRFSNGVVRVNVEDDDGTVYLENHHDTKDLLGSMTDTVLTVP